MPPQLMVIVVPTFLDRSAKPARARRVASARQLQARGPGSPSNARVHWGELTGESLVKPLRERQNLDVGARCAHDLEAAIFSQPRQQRNGHSGQWSRRSRP